MWFDGNIVEASQARISALSPSANFGLNVFEGIRCYQAANSFGLNIFRLDAHVDRLRKSCKIMRIDGNIDESKVYEAIGAVLNANELKEDCAVRIVVMVDGEGSWHATGPTNMLITATPRPRHNVNNLSGYSATVSSWMRIDDNMMPPRVKAGLITLTVGTVFCRRRKMGMICPYSSTVLARSQRVVGHVCL